MARLLASQQLGPSTYLQSHLANSYLPKYLHVLGNLRPLAASSLVHVGPKQGQVQCTLEECTLEEYTMEKYTLEKYTPRQQQQQQQKLC